MVNRPGLVSSPKITAKPKITTQNSKPKLMISSLLNPSRLLKSFATTQPEPLKKTSKGSFVKSSTILVPSSTNLSSLLKKTNTSKQTDVSEYLATKVKLNSGSKQQIGFSKQPSSGSQGRTTPKMDMNTEHRGFEQARKFGTLQVPKRPVINRLGKYSEKPENEKSSSNSSFKSDLQIEIV